MKNNGKLSISFMLAYTDEIDLIQMANGRGAKNWCFETILNSCNNVRRYLEGANEDNTNEHILKFYRRIEDKYSTLVYILERM